MNYKNTSAITLVVASIWIMINLYASEQDLLLIIYGVNNDITMTTGFLTVFILLTFSPLAIVVYFMNKHKLKLQAIKR